MTWNNLYFLPILALIACMVLPVLPNKRRSRRLQNTRDKSQAYATYFSRWLVFSLLAATAITLLFPLGKFQPIVQGALVTALLVVPALIFVAISYFTIRHTEKSHTPAKDAYHSHAARSHAASQLPYSARSIDSRSRISRSNPGLHDALTSSQKAEFAEIGSRNPDSSDELLSLPESYQDDVDHYDDMASINFRTNDTLDDTSDLLEDDLEFNSVDDTIADDAILKGQLERVSNNVDSYDIGVDIRHNQPANSRNSQIEIDNYLRAGDPAVYNDAFDKFDLHLPQKSEKALILKRKFIALQQDKKRLQRLVIAQQASLDSEQTAHERSKTMAKEAIKIMRDARESQRIAVKVARLERSKRKKIENEYVKMNKALVNALSTIQRGQTKNSVWRG